ncbi:PAS domain S-box protein [candidate division WWE3 bacterium]|nr:PAS domain S-box protein [candidate division WWE3 bacterium]
MKLSIRSKLIIGFTTVLFLSFLVQTVLFNMVENYIFLQVKDIQHEKVEETAYQVNDFITTTHLRLLALGQQYAQYEQNASSTEFIMLAKLAMSELDYIEQISVLSPAGRELVKLDKYTVAQSDDLTFEIPTTPFQSALKGEADVSKVYFPQGSSVATINFYTPIISPDKKIIGVIQAQIKLTRVQNIIEQDQFGADGIAYLLDDEGRLIAHPDTTLVADAPNFSTRKLIYSYLFGDPDTLTNDDYFYVNQKDKRVFAQAIRLPDTKWLMVVEQPDTEAFSFLNFIRTFFYTTGAGSAVLLIVISLFLSRNISSPILKLREWTKAITQRNYNSEPNIQSGDEIENLAASFKQMTQEIRSREHKIETEKQQMERLLESMTEGVIAINAKGTILLFNRAVTSITGITSKDAIGKHIDKVIQLFADTDQVRLSIYSELPDQLKNEYEEKGLYIYTLRGRITVSVKVAPVQFDEPDSNGWILTIHDITMTQKLEEMKLDFVAMAAHELRTPLTAIRGYLDILSEDLKDRLSDQEKMFLSRTTLSAAELASLVENLLTVSRIEKGNMSLDLKLYSLEEVVGQVCNNSMDLSKEKGITLTLVPPTQPIPQIYMDRFRIAEVISNLVSNGISYTQPGGKVTIEMSSADGYVMVKVCDTGQGIPAEAIPHLFTKFYRVSRTLEQGSKGTGLGLFISKAIIKAHKGSIWVESKVKQGTSFTFKLPLDPRN